MKFQAPKRILARARRYLEPRLLFGSFGQVYEELYIATDTLREVINYVNRREKVKHGEDKTLDKLRDILIEMGWDE